MSLPAHSHLTPASPPTLAEAVARARWPRDRAVVQLAPHREELLRLRQTGASVGSLVGGLRLIGIEVQLPILARDIATGQETYVPHAAWSIVTPEPEPREP